jgi:hypothetical protein
MATLVRTGLNVCEIDSQNPNQISTSSCDCGRYTSKVNNCFFNFDTINSVVVAGSVVSSAVLRLAQVSSDYSRELPIRIKLCAGNWGSYTWNSQPADAGAGSVDVSLSGSGAGDREFNVTSLVQWIVNNNSGAHIFKLERFPNDMSGSGDAKSFSTTAGNHQLTVEYTAPTAPSPPTGLNFSSGVFESTAILGWSAGSGGYNNPITSYHVYYRVNGGSQTFAGSTAGTSLTINTSGIERGASLTFQVAALSNYAGAVWSAQSGAATRNRKPNTPSGVSMSKPFYAPGETLRIKFTSTGDADGNLAGFEAALGDNETVLASRPVSSENYVDIPGTGWASGVKYAFRVRGVDALGQRSDWSDTASAMIGLPVFVQPAADGVFRRVVSMQVYVPGEGFKMVKSMKIAPAQGAINKTVF